MNHADFCRVETLTRYAFKSVRYFADKNDTKVLAQAEVILANVRHAALFLGPDPGLLATKEQRQQAIDRLVVELFGEVPHG